MATAADPYQDILTPYNASIGTLYDTLKKSYVDQAKVGLDFNAQLKQHMNDAVNANQAFTTGLFDRDQNELTSMAARMNAPDVNTAMTGLQQSRDRLAALHGLAQSQASDRMGYLGGIQDQYMNRLGDSAAATGAMKQASLISDFAKIKAQAAAAAAAARRGGGGGGGGGGGSSAAGAATGSASTTDTFTGSQDASATEAFNSLSTPLQQLLQSYSPRTGGDLSATMKMIADDYYGTATTPSVKDLIDKVNQRQVYHEENAASRPTVSPQQRMLYDAYPTLSQWFNSMVPWMGYTSQKHTNTATSNQRQNYGGFNMPTAPAQQSSGWYNSGYFGG
jgi:hypothetical protein